MWVTIVALQIMLNDKYKLNHCKEMGAEPGRRFLIQPAAKLEPELLLFKIKQMFCENVVMGPLNTFDVYTKNNLKSKDFQNLYNV